MKTKNLAILFSVIVAAFIGTSCSENLNGISDEITTAEKSQEIAALFGDSCTFTGTLTEEDISGLMAMREEEKLAHDVYSYFFEKYNQVIFNNISASEISHASAVLYLIDGYGLTDPTPENVGEFFDQQFTEMFEQLTAEGSVSLIEALKVGALIEETDIADLEELLTATENEDIIRVYSHLLAGSKKHLNAFTNILVQYGEAYIPVILSDEEYQTILNDSANKGRYGTNSASQGNRGNRKGSRNQAPGNGYGNGNGKN